MLDAPRLRRSARLIEAANRRPPLKKQRLGSSNSGNRGHRGSYPQLVGLSPDTSPKDFEEQSEIEYEYKSESEFEYKSDHDNYYWKSSGSEDLGSHSEPERHVNNESDDDDSFFKYCCSRDGRKIYIICLKHRCQEESRCENILKEIGCEPYFMRLSKTYRRRFYARLTEDDAEKLKCVQGVASVTAASRVAIMD